MSNVLKMLSRGGAAAAETDPNFNQTVLLLHGDGTNGAQNNTFLDSSTNNFTITRNGNTTQGTFSPFSVGAGEWSNYFDGNGDYLSISSSASPSGTEDFCVEFWYTPGIKPSNYPTIFSTNTTYSFSTAFQIYDRHDAYITKFSVYGCGINGMASTTTVTPGVTYHIAVTRNLSGGVYTLRLFVNGVLEASQTGASGSLSSNSCFIGRADTASLALSYLNGYVSNFRIVRGSSVYTSAFTPPTAPLTNITNTSLLTCQSNRFVDNSTNNFTITRNGDVKVTPFSPFAPSAAYDPAVNGGSGYFDGSGDNLTVADNAAFDLGSGNLSIELFCYFSAYTAGTLVVLLSNYQDVTNGWTIGVASTTSKFYGSISGNSVVLNDPNNLILNSWNHVALVRTGTTVSLFVNGSRVATNTDSTNVTSTANVHIGSAVGGSFNFNGYISNPRVIKGNHPYDATQTTITVPTAPLTAITNTSLLLNFTNAGIFDQTGKNNLETVGNAQVDTNIKKYGTGSMKFDGSGDYLTILNLDGFQFGTGNFTVEFWLYANSSSTTHGLIAASLTGSGYWASLIFSGLIYWQSPNGATNLLSASYSGYYDTWTHVAFVRNSGTTKLYLDGIEKASASDATNYNGASGFYDIGRDQDNSAFLTGYIDDLRITKGVARYTANFTPPTKEFPDL